MMRDIKIAWYVLFNRYLRYVAARTLSNAPSPAAPPPPPHTISTISRSWCESAPIAMDVA